MWNKLIILTMVLKNKLDSSIHDSYPPIHPFTHTVLYQLYFTCLAFIRPWCSSPPAGACAFPAITTAGGWVRTNAARAFGTVSRAGMDSSEDKRKCHITTIAAYLATRTATTVVMRHFLIPLQCSARPSDPKCFRGPPIPLLIWPPVHCFVGL